MATTKQRKVHLTSGQTDAAIEDTVTACGESTKRRRVTDDPTGVTCPDCIVGAGGISAGEAKADQDDRPEAVTVAPEPGETLTGDALIARKRLAGAGRSAEAGTAFGSRWTDFERAELQEMFAETWNRAETATKFAEAHPYRTRQSVLYQIDRNLKKPTPAQKAEGASDDS